MIFVDQGMTKYILEIFKCQYFVEVFRYGSNFLHVIITFIGFKITFSNIRSHGAPLLISRGWPLAISDLGFKRVFIPKPIFKDEIDIELKKEDEVKNKDKLKMKNKDNHKVYSHKNDVGLRNKDKDYVPLLQPLLYSLK